MRLLVLLATFQLAWLLAECETLKALFVFQRHGDRAPTESRLPPNYPYRNATYWPNGFDQLTERGRKRMFNVGRFLRQQYADFLSDDTREVAVLSSALERCVETGRLTVRGAYPAINQTKLRSVSHVDEEMLTPFICPTFKSKMHEVFELDEIKKFEIDHRHIYGFLTLKFGERVDHLKLDDFSHTLKCEMAEGLPRSFPWITDKVIEQMQELESKMFSWMVYTDELKRLMVGLSFGELKRQIENYENDLNTIKKLNLYETHEPLLASLLISLGVYTTIPFGATLVFELHGSSGTDDEPNYIQILYLNETESKSPHRLQLPGCDNPCTTEQFLTLIAPLATEREEFEKECKPYHLKATFWDASMITKTVCLVLASALVLFSLTGLLKKYRQDCRESKSTC